MYCDKDSCCLYSELPDSCELTNVMLYTIVHLRSRVKALESKHKHKKENKKKGPKANKRRYGNDRFTSPGSSPVSTRRVCR